MATYYELLREAREKAIAFVSTARVYVPQMYNALRAENLNISPEDAGNRIRRDCLGIWTRRTILAALPDEAKDPKKQKAGRLSRKEDDSAAFSAASETPNAKKEIEINTEGNCIGSDPYQINESIKVSASTRGRQSYNNLPFELSVPAQDVMQQVLDDLADGRKDSPILISGVLDIRTGKVITASVGRRTPTNQATSYTDIDKNNCNMS